MVVQALVTVAVAATALLAGHAAVNARLLRRPLHTASAVSRAAGAGTLPWLSLLVPARDEAARIGPCVQALLSQRGVDLELLVLDDGSTDGTADVVRSVAGGDARVRVLTGAPLPPGWLGKPHACAQLAEAARGAVLVFVDADVVLAPGGLAATAALLEEAGLDLVCPYPRQVTGTPAERLVQPLLQWSWLTFLPLRLAERLRAPSLCAANGQLLACRVEAYRAAGGHRGVRDQVIEDVELARAFKRAGLRVAIADGTDVATCRMYQGWAQVRDGYTKSLWAAFGSGRGTALAVVLLSWLYLLPPAAAVAGLLRGEPALAALGLAGYGAGVAGRVSAARRTGGRALDGLAHPVSIGLLVWLVVRSCRHRASGRLRWRGRPVP